MAKELDVKKIIKDAKDEFGKEMKRHIGAMFERFDDSLEAVKEQYDGFNKRFDRIDTTLESHTEEIGKLMVKMTSVEFDIKDLKKNVAENTADIKELKKNVAENTNDIKDLRMDIIEVKRDVRDTKFSANVMLQNTVDKKHFVDLEGRVRKLEKVK